MCFKLSLVIPYYNHPLFLKNQVNLWNSYSDYIKRNVEIIIVDDGSEKSLDCLIIEGKMKVPKNLKVFRILEDIYWNVKGARNLGAKVSESDWLLFHDFDHWFLEEDLKNIIEYPKGNKIIYQFKRFREGNEASLHKETILINKNCFLNRIGGHDEDFVGIYGGGYSLFYEMAKRKGMSVRIMEGASVLTVDNNKFKDLMGSEKVKENRDRDKLKKLRQDKLSGKIPISNNIIRFNWERVI